MTDVRDELWAALLEVGKVRWMPGMRSLHSGMGPAIVTGEAVHPADHFVCKEGSNLPGFRVEMDYATPDWENPATLGCLTAMAREAWGRAHIFVHYDGGDDEAADEEEPGRWMVYAPWEPDQDWAGCIVHGYDTEAEALLRAIKAAP